VRPVGYADVEWSGSVTTVLADPGLSFGGPRSSAEGARLEAPRIECRGAGVWRGVSPSPMGEGSGEGQNFFIFCLVHSDI